MVRKREGEGVKQRERYRETAGSRECVYIVKNKSRGENKNKRKLNTNFDVFIRVMLTHFQWMTGLFQSWLRW